MHAKQTVNMATWIHWYIGTLADGYMTGGLDFVAQGSSLHCGLVAIIVAS